MSGECVASDSRSGILAIQGRSDDLNLLKRPIFDRRGRRILTRESRLRSYKQDSYGKDEMFQ